MTNNLAPMTLAPITQDVGFRTWRWQDKTAKLSLKFNDNVLQEVVLSGGVVTIGRQPDNLIRIDNPIVSGHHARIFWENNHYVLEDNESFNATYLNNRRVSRAACRKDRAWREYTEDWRSCKQDEVWSASVTTTYWTEL